MKKIALFTAILFFALSGTAQTGFGFQVGANMAKAKSEENYPNEEKYESNYDSKFGFLAGLVVEVPMGTSFMFRPELNFIQKGAEIDEIDTETSGGFSYTEQFVGDVKMNFVELPLNFVYTKPLGGGQFFVGVGPSIGFGISGNYNAKITTTLVVPGLPDDRETMEVEGDVTFDGEKEEDLSPGDEDIHLKSLDIGANALIGYKFSNGLFLNLGYAKGFSNLDPNQYQKLTTSGFQLKLGFIFGGNKSSD